MTAILPLQNPPRIRGGFETIVAQLIGRDGQPLPESEWRRGVTGMTLPDSEFFTNALTGGSWGDPGSDPDAAKPFSSFGDEVRFLPSSIGVNFLCAMNAPNTTRGDFITDTVRNEIDRRLWSEIAHHIQADGTTIACAGDTQTNPTLKGVAQLPDGYVDNAPGDIEGVIQGLLDMVCGGAHTDPVLLAPYAWKSHFTRRGIVKWEESIGAYVALGVHRMAFDCIDNSGPAGTTTNPDGSELWIYAMIPPQLAVANEGPGDNIAVRSELENIYRVRGERQFGYWFDTNHVYAAKATVL